MGACGELTCYSNASPQRTFRMRYLLCRQAPRNCCKHPPRRCQHLSLHPGPSREIEGSNARIVL